MSPTFNMNQAKFDWNISKGCQVHSLSITAFNWDDFYYVFYACNISAEKCFKTKTFSLFATY